MRAEASLTVKRCQRRRADDHQTVGVHGHTIQPNSHAVYWHIHSRNPGIVHHVHPASYLGAANCYWAASWDAHRGAALQRARSRENDADAR
jgi:hypothetical protein